MLRLDQRYFRTLVWPFLGVLIVLAALGYFFLRNLEIANHRTMLHNLITQYTLTLANDISGSGHLRALHHQTGVRTTLIDANGTVTAESNRAPQGMNNHYHRPEIMEARTRKWGSSVRHSATLDRDMLYVAHRHGTLFIRMAYPLSTIREAWLPLWLKTLALLGLALGIALWITTRINRHVSADVQRIHSHLDHLLAKKHDHIADRVECCQELSTISRQINTVAAKLKKRNQQKSKHAKKLKSLTQQQSQIISAISHEFKNPVAAISGYATTLYDDPDLSPQLQKRFTEKVIRNAERISDMIDRLSLAIKFENHTLEAKKELIDLERVLEDVVQNLRQKYPQRTIHLLSETTPVLADRIMFSQAMSNLIDNALKYSEEAVDVTLRSHTFRVEDQGIGIEPEALKKITKRFYRADTQSWDNSLGVGLFIVEYILKLHATELEIESTPGLGSVFGFSLPTK